MAQAGLNGMKVVRGPDWIWSDQDGGEGHIGTIIIDEADEKQKMYLPQTISVQWQSGLKAQYRAGLHGAHDLRVVDCKATGMKHPGISCGGTDCTVREILGIRWQCVACDVDLCTDCFLKEVPHNASHNQFKRYDNNEMIDPPKVSSWSENGPESRIKLIGMMGSYSPEAFSVLNNPVSTNTFPFCSPTNPFCVGDRVQIDPGTLMNGATVQILDPSEEFDKAKGATGIVRSVKDSEILVDFAEKGIKLRVKPTALIKLNKFSINQVVKIRNDRQTIREIEKEFEIYSINLDTNKPEGAIGRVVGFNLDNPEEVYVQFDDYKIYDWLGRYSSLSSAYLEAHQTIQSNVDQELVELDFKAAELFNNAVYAGDLRTAQILHHRYGVNLEGRNADGQTALHVAIQQGHQDIVRWLLDTAGINLERFDNLYRREIHHAVTRCNPKILEMVLDFVIDMDSVAKSGETALDIAVDNELLECARMLIDDPGKCNVNIQDSEGNTPLHRAEMRGSSKIIEILVSSGRIDWNLRNQKGYNIFHLSVCNKSHKIIEHFLKNDQQKFLFEWVSNTGHTVAQYACKYFNTEAMKLMISGAGQHMNQLLETRIVKSTMTPLLFSCSKMIYPIIELLVDAGADLKAVDENGNTAAIIADSSSVMTLVPIRMDSPEIFKHYVHLDKMKHPVLALLVYLVRNGCDWEAANKAGKKASDILREKGYSKELVDLLDQMASKYKRLPVGPNGCMMGENGECAAVATFRVSCPHKAPIEVCPSCVILTFNHRKCGCKDEKMPSIPIADTQKVTIPNEQKDDDVLKWVDDGEKGYIEDGEANKFVICNKRTRKDGSYGYRCEFKSESGVQCPAMARRFFSEKEDNFSIELEGQHRHSDLKKSTKSAARKRTKTTSDGGDSTLGPSGSKQKRMS